MPPSIEDRTTATVYFSKGDPRWPYITDVKIFEFELEPDSEMPVSKAVAQAGFQPEEGTQLARNTINDAIYLMIHGKAFPVEGIATIVFPILVETDF